VVAVRPDRLLPLLRTLRDGWGRFRSLTDLWAVDRPDRLRRFQLQYLLLSYDHNLRLRLRVDLDGRPCPSAGPLFPAARWLEREVWDLFGLPFAGHPDLRRLLTDYGFEGHPLRRDFPLVGFLEVRYDELAKRVVLEPLELTQDYRHFDFNLPWIRGRHRS
jgi:NADH-quinone oxidoreductase subunit C